MLRESGGLPLPRLREEMRARNPSFSAVIPQDMPRVLAIHSVARFSDEERLFTGLGDTGAAESEIPFEVRLETGGERDDSPTFPALE